MKQSIFIFPREGMKLPTIGELRIAGFVVSSAMASVKEIDLTDQELPTKGKDDSMLPFPHEEQLNAIEKTEY